MNQSRDVTERVSDSAGAEVGVGEGSTEYETQYVVNRSTC